MATYKRVDGDYNITTINPEDYVNITTHTVKVYGNLDVAGNITYIEATELKVDDPFITVAANNTGNLVTALFQDQGLVTQTSSNTWAGIRFDNPANTWQISSSVYANGDPIASYVNIASATTASPGGANTNIQFNDGGSFGGNSSLSFDKSNSLLTLNGTLSMGYQSGIATTANLTTIWSNNVGAGGTGVYFDNGGTTGDELVSRSKAIIFSLIF